MKKSLPTILLITTILLALISSELFPIMGFVVLTLITVRSIQRGLIVKLHKLIQDFKTPTNLVLAFFGLMIFIIGLYAEDIGFIKEAIFPTQLDFSNDQILKNELITELIDTQTVIISNDPANSTI